MKQAHLQTSICILLLTLFCYTAQAQAPNIQWQKTLGGSGFDAASCSKQTSDGGYIVAGRTSSNDGDVTGNHGDDFWIVKLNNAGSIEWQKALGGSGGDQANSIQQTSDGGYIVVGSTGSNDGDVTGKNGSDDYWVVKLSSTGSIVWQKTMGGSLVDRATSIQQTNDGGYIVAGYTYSNNGDVSGNHGDKDYWVVKLNSLGSIIWQKCLGGSSADEANSIVQTNDGGYIVAGSTFSNNGDVTGNHGLWDYWIVKLSNLGAVEWQKALGGSDFDYAFSIQQTNDGDYIVGGQSKSNDGNLSGNKGNYDSWIIKLNNSGSIQWQKNLGGSEYDRAFSIQQTFDGGFIFLGETNSNDGDVTGNHSSVSDSWIVKLNNIGNLLWQKTLGGSLQEEGLSIQQTSDEGYILTGNTNSNDGDVTGYHGGGDFWIVKLNPPPIPTAPSIQWQKALGGTSYDAASNAKQTTDGGYIVVGNTLSKNGDVSGNHGLFDYWVVKTNSTGTIQWQKALGSSNTDNAYSIQQTNDGGYIVAGFAGYANGDVTFTHGNRDYWVVKLSSTGNIQWDRSFGGSNQSLAYSIQQTSDGGYIVAGNSNADDGDITGHHGGSPTDYWVVKLNSTGGLMWQNSYGGDADDNAYSIQQTSDGGYIIAGNTISNNGDVTGNHSFLGYDYWVVKINSLGILQWQKTLGGNGEDKAYSIQQTLDGGYIVAGYTGSNNGDVTNQHGSYDAWVVKLNSTGTLQWQKTLGGSGDDQAKSVQQTADGGYIISGTTASNDGDANGNHGSYDYWVVKLSSKGNLQWQKTLGGSGDDEASSIQQTNDGGFIVSGFTNSNDGDVTGYYANTDYWVVKLSPEVICSPTTSSTSIAICSGLLPYLWNGLTFNGSGSQTAHLTNRDGCDSAATLVLTVISSLPAITGANAICVGGVVTLSNTIAGGAWSSLNNRATANATTGVVTGASQGTATIAYKYTAGGCNLTTTTSFAVNSLPYIPSIGYAVGTRNPQYGSGGAFCANKTFTVVGSPSGGVWSKTGVISVTSPAGLVTTGSIAGAGSLTYTYTNVNGCSSSRTIAGNVVVCASRGVNGITNEKQETRNEFTMYPNPAKSIISLNVNTLIGAGTIVFTDLYGKQVKTQTLSIGTNTIDVSSFVKGIYFVSTITSEGKKTKKLVVE